MIPSLEETWEMSCRDNAEEAWAVSPHPDKFIASSRSALELISLSIYFSVHTWVSLLKGCSVFVYGDI